MPAGSLSRLESARRYRESLHERTDLDDREKYLEIKKFWKRSRKPVKLADTSNLPKCTYCNSRFASLSDLKDHQFNNGCSGQSIQDQDKLHVKKFGSLPIYLKKPAATSTIDQENKGVSE